MKICILVIFRFLEGQDDGDLPDLGRLPGGEAEVENAPVLVLALEL